MSRDLPPIYHVPQAVREYLRELILQAHKQGGSMLEGDQERLVVEQFLPTLRLMRDHMVKRKELSLKGGRYQTTGLVPTPKPGTGEEIYELRYGDLTVEWESYGHTTWIWGEVSVGGGRHPGQYLESLQARMKRVEKWARGRSFTQEEFSAQVNKDED